MRLCKPVGMSDGSRPAGAGLEVLDVSEKERVALLI